MIAVHFGYWKELLVEWAEQKKIPSYLAENNYDGSAKDRELDELIGWDFNWSTTRSGAIGLMPEFEYKVLETFPDGTKRVQNSLGLIERIKPGVASIPSEDDYLLKDREAFETLYRGKMQFYEERVDLEYWKNFNATRDYDRPVGLFLGSVLGDIRSMTSVIGMSYLLYDEDEDLFADIIDTYADMRAQSSTSLISGRICALRVVRSLAPKILIACAQSITKSVLTCVKNTVLISFRWTATALPKNFCPPGLTTA